MKKIFATAAVLAFAGAASASPFIVNGPVDFSGGTVAGGNGSALTFDGTADLVPGGFGTPAGFWNGTLAQTGVAIATPDFSTVAAVANAPGSAGFTDGQYAGAYFNSQGFQIPSGPITVDGNSFDAVLLGNFDSGVSNINFEIAFVDVSSNTMPFNGFDALNEFGYSLTLVDNGAGGNLMYVINGVIPTPGAAGLLGLAGLAASRRRR